MDGQVERGRGRGVADNSFAVGRQWMEIRGIRAACKHQVAASITSTSSVLACRTMRNWWPRQRESLKESGEEKLPRTALRWGDDWLDLEGAERAVACPVLAPAGEERCPKTILVSYAEHQVDGRQLGGTPTKWLTSNCHHGQHVNKSSL